MSASRPSSNPYDHHASGGGGGGAAPGGSNDPNVPPILEEAFNRYYKNGYVYRCQQCSYECNMRQMVAGDGHAHQRARHGWDYAQDRDKFSGFAAVPTADMIGAYAQSVPRRDGVNGVTAAEVGVQPDFSCSADRVAQFSHGLDCSVMAGTAVGPPPSSFAAAKGGLAGGSEGSSSSGQGVRRFSAPTSSPIGFRIR